MKETILGFLGAQILRLLHSTLRIERHGLEVHGRHWSRASSPVIVAFWHSDQLMGPWSYFDPPSSHLGPARMARVLISQHSDGRIIAEALRFLGIENIPGSSTRGGVRALVQMKNSILKDGTNITITPDGPKGPARVAKAGAIILASQTGAPILPIAFGYSRAWKARSWDKMLLPKPFARGRIIGGELLYVPKELGDDDIARYSQVLTDRLNSLKRVAEDFSQSISSTNLSYLVNNGQNTAVRNSDNPQQRQMGG